MPKTITKTQICGSKWSSRMPFSRMLSSQKTMLGIWQWRVRRSLACSLEFQERIAETSLTWTRTLPGRSPTSEPRRTTWWKQSMKAEIQAHPRTDFSITSLSRKTLDRHPPVPAACSNISGDSKKRQWTNLKVSSRTNPHSSKIEHLFCFDFTIISTIPTISHYLLFSIIFNFSILWGFGVLGFWGFS